MHSLEEKNIIKGLFDWRQGSILHEMQIYVLSLFLKSPSTSFLPNWRTIEANIIHEKQPNLMRSTG